MVYLDKFFILVFLVMKRAKERTNFSIAKCATFYG